MGGVRDELALCAFAPLALGDVGEDEHGGVGAPRRGQTGDDEGRVGVRADRQAGRSGVGVEEPGDERPEPHPGPRVGERTALPRVGTEQLSRATVREHDAEAAIDGDDCLLQLFEELSQAIAFAFEVGERPCEMHAHLVDGLCQFAQFVGESRS